MLIKLSWMYSAAMLTLLIWPRLGVGTETPRVVYARVERPSCRWHECIHSLIEETRLKIV
mgnify:CR=1 FL=1